MPRLLHEQDLIGIVWLLDDTREVHRVVDLILGLEHLFEAKIVMALLQGVKRDVLVVL